MSKKIDIKRTLGSSAKPLSIEAVEEMTQLIHNKKTEPAQGVPVIQPAKIPVAPVETATIAEVAPPSVSKAKKQVETIDSGKRGRKPKLMIETERLLRVSVDLPESVFIQLKIAVIQQQTDMKSYIRNLVEKDMARK